MISLPKNKKVTILLLVAVVGIWGTIIYKVISTIMNKDNYAIPTRFPKQKTVKPEEIAYQLHTYDRDPFLSILTDTAEVIFEDTVEYTPPVPRRAPLPQPIYCGLIKNDRTITAILKIHSEYHFLKKGEKDDLVNVLKIKDDEITIIYDNERMTIPITTDEQ